MVGVRDQVGLLCDQIVRWPKLEGRIRDEGAGAALDRLLATLADEGEPDPDEVTDLVETIDARAVIGLAGLIGRDAFRPLPQGFSDRAGFLGWVCPRDRCDRVVLPEETAPGTAPTCALFRGTAMKAFTAPTS